MVWLKDWNIVVKYKKEDNIEYMISEERIRSLDKKAAKALIRVLPQNTAVKVK